MTERNFYNTVNLVTPASKMKGASGMNLRIRSWSALTVDGYGESAPNGPFETMSSRQDLIYCTIR